MKKNDVIIGAVYLVKVSGDIAGVKITGESVYGGWDGVNLSTNRRVRVKTAARLRRKIANPKAKPGRKVKVKNPEQFAAECPSVAGYRNQTGTVTEWSDRVNKVVKVRFEDDKDLFFRVDELTVTQ